MSHEPIEAAPEDVPLFAALASLHEAPHGERVDGADGSEAAAQERLYLEVLGLLPLELEPVAPPVAVRQKLFAELGLLEPLDEAAGPVAPHPAVAAVPTEVAKPLPFVPPARPARPARRWPMALAAGIVIASLGTSVYLFNGLREQSERIDTLAQQLTSERERAERATVDMKAARTHLDEMRDHVRVVTSPAALVSTLRPSGAAPLQPAAGGVLFVQSDHQHWYLALRGLAPPGAGRCYQVWFVSATGMVSAGVVHPAPGAPMEMGSSTMPRGTQGILVTLEPKPGGTSPSGPEVLRGMPFQTL
ncbi:MAG TPA: anti-sigma factor [Thermoanaerobaculia bacterium]